MLLHHFGASSDPDYEPVDMRIAALLTCHNRRATTFACLEALSAQSLESNTECAIYLVDDGCTDGTAEAVRRCFPEVHIIPGPGNLYWCGGMRTAWSAAVGAADYDAYLWLNDDVKLFPVAVTTLVTSWHKALAAGHPGLIVGSTCDPGDGRITYGGTRGDKLVEPSSELQMCDRINGNIVLVPRAIFNVVGNLSPDFRHVFGDMDYGFRARKAGFALWFAPHFLGECCQNPCPPWADPSVCFFRRWRSIHSPTVFPVRENFIFCMRHYGGRGLIRLLKLYFRVLFPGPWNGLKRLVGRNQGYSRTQ